MYFLSCSISKRGSIEIYVCDIWRKGQIYALNNSNIHRHMGKRRERIGVVGQLKLPFRVIQIKSTKQSCSPTADCYQIPHQKSVVNQQTSYSNDNQTELSLTLNTIEMIQVFERIVEFNRHSEPAPVSNYYRRLEISKLNPTSEQEMFESLGTALYNRGTAAILFHRRKSPCKYRAAPHARQRAAEDSSRFSRKILWEASSCLCLSAAMRCSWYLVRFLARKCVIDSIRLLGIPWDALRFFCWCCCYCCQYHNIREGVSQEREGGCCQMNYYGFFEMLWNSVQIPEFKQWISSSRFSTASERFRGIFLMDSSYLFCFSLSRRWRNLIRVRPLQCPWPRGGGGSRVTPPIGQVAQLAGAPPPRWRPRTPRRTLQPRRLFRATWRPRLLFIFFSFFWSPSLSVSLSIFLSGSLSRCLRFVFSPPFIVPSNQFIKCLMQETLTGCHVSGSLLKSLHASRLDWNKSKGV